MMGLNNCNGLVSIVWPNFIISSSNNNIKRVKIAICMVVLVSFAMYSTEAAKLPSRIGRCHQSDPNFDDCLQVNIEDAIHSFKDDTPELNFTTLEPLFIPELVIGQGHGPVNVVQHFFDIHLHGLTGSKVLKLRSNLDNSELYAESVTPSLRLEARYSMNGRVLLLPVFGDGPCNVTLLNTKINHTLVGERFVRRGRSFMKIDRYTVTLRPERMTFNFENLFNGDKLLGDNINNILNENWSEVFVDVRDGYERSFGLIFQNLANQVFKRVPFDDIFLD